ncbi:MAG: type II toxin-antitoxin system VapC family toxin [Wenzhouxiangella sp.]
MKIILDTHTLLWWWTDDRRLSASARSLISDTENRILVSAASAWEISTKQRLGKLDSLPAVSLRFAELLAADGFEHLPISHVHSLRAGSFECPHRDPFDRILAAQSALEMAPLLTRDPAFAQFSSKTLW